MKRIILFLIFTLLLITACSKTFDECDINKDGEVDSKEEKVCFTDLGDCISGCIDDGKAPKLCLTECQEKQDEEQTTGTEYIITSSASHSFGIHPSSLENYEYAHDLGIDFNREGMYFVWTWIDTGRDGHFSFENAMISQHPDRPGSGGIMRYDEERRKLAAGKDIEHMVNVCAFQRKVAKEEFKSSEEKKIYQEFVEKLVERYDGDSDLGCTQPSPDCYNEGDGEYPKQSLIDALQVSPIKYWQACNQVIDACLNDCKETYAEKYAEFLELTYKGVKASCADCQVLIAGDSAKEMYPSVYKALNGEYVDIIDKHFFGMHNDYMKISEEMDYLKNSLVDSGFDLDELRFWTTEVGTYSGDPVEDKGDIVTEGPPYQSEKQQAQGLVKRYIYSFGEGFEKVLWAWGLIEDFGCECCIFDYTGLIYDGNDKGQECDVNDPYDLGKGVKKLSYYSLKKMIEKIGGFTEIEKVQENDFVYVYKLIDDGTPIWIGWSENVTKSVILDVEDADQIMITDSVPKFVTGNEVINYDTSFNTEIKYPRDNAINITLSGVPVYIEVIK